MLRPPGDGARSLLANLFGEFHVVRGDAAGVTIVWQRRQRDIAALELGRGDKLSLALVPRGQDLGRGGAAQDARVDETREFYVRDVSGRAVDALEVPDCFCAVFCVSWETLGWKG
jgi:hypothetical protein